MGRRRAVADWFCWLWAALSVAHAAAAAEPLARIVVQPGAVGVAYDAASAAPAVSAWCDALGEHRSFAALLAAWRRAAALSLEAGLSVDAAISAAEPVAERGGSGAAWSVHGTVRLVASQGRAAELERMVTAAHRDSAALHDDRGGFMVSAATGRLWWTQAETVIVCREGPQRPPEPDTPHTPRADTALRLWVDLNALRRAHDAEFEDHRPLPRALQLLAVANTRWISVDAVTIGPAEADRARLLVARVSWSARSDPPSVSNSIEIGERRWPNEVKFDIPGRWAMVLRADPMGPGPRDAGGGWVAWARLFSAIGAATAGDAAEHARQQWFLRRGDAARSAGASLGRWAVLTGGLPGAGNGELVLIAPLRGSGDAAESAIRTVLADFTPGVVARAGPCWVLAAAVPAVCDGMAWRTAVAGKVPVALSVLSTIPRRPAPDACNAIAERLAR